jgi:hypothetical protein
VGGHQPRDLPGPGPAPRFWCHARHRLNAPYRQSLGTVDLQVARRPDGLLPRTPSGLATTAIPHPKCPANGDSSQEALTIHGVPAALGIHSRSMVADRGHAFTGALCMACTDTDHRRIAGFRASGERGLRSRPLAALSLAVGTFCNGITTLRHRHCHGRAPLTHAARLAQGGRFCASRASRTGRRAR